MPTILSVDDDPAVLQLLGDFVKGMGYNFISAMDGIIATQIVQRRRPDLIILDYHMPAAHGVTVLERIQRVLQDASIPVIFLSGSAKDEEVRKMIEAFPRCRFLTKPVKLPLLGAMIRELLREPPGAFEEEEEHGPKTIIDLDAEEPPAP